MLVPAELKSSYEVVLHDLESERDGIIERIATDQARVKELNFSISLLTKKINTEAPSTISGSPFGARPANQKYASMSVRWAILDVMADSEPKNTAEIAEVLISAGVQTRAANFANNVSAVLSTTMKETHKEVEQQPDGKWRLTEKGRGAIEHIRTTERFQSALRGGNRGFVRF